MKLQIPPCVRIKDKLIPSLLDKYLDELILMQITFYKESVSHDQIRRFNQKEKEILITKIYFYNNEEIFQNLF